MSKKSIRSLLSLHKSLLLPVAHDALTAKLIELTGFHAFSIGGFGVAASAFGKPDNGSVKFNELFPVFRNILNATDLPALVDADTGYGGPRKAAAVVRAYEQAGASAIFIEDQTWPKRCGHTDGHRLISVSAMQAKIKAAKMSLRNSDTMLMARTDSISAEGSLHSAIVRSKAYIAAGADAIFIEAPRTEAEVREIPRALPETILLINLMEGGKTPLVPHHILSKWGFQLIARPITTILAQTNAINQALSNLKEDGKSTDRLTSNSIDFQLFREIIGL